MCYLIVRKSLSRSSGYNKETFRKMKRKILYTFLYVLVLVAGACRDDLLGSEDDFIPDGESRLTAMVKFKPLIPALNGKSRMQEMR